jgi:hypothetical protein
MECTWTKLILRGESKYARRRVVNAQGAVELQYHAFLTPGLDGGERPASSPSLFTLRERVPVKAFKVVSTPETDWPPDQVAARILENLPSEF